MLSNKQAKLWEFTLERNAGCREGPVTPKDGSWVTDKETPHLYKNHTHFPKILEIQETQQLPPLFITSLGNINGWTSMSIRKQVKAIFKRRIKNLAKDVTFALTCFVISLIIFIYSMCVHTHL